MGEAPRARITAQNILTTWHADRLYGAMVIVIMLTPTVQWFVGNPLCCINQRNSVTNNWSWGEAYSREAQNKIGTL
eukprot:scaffold7980_cov71-Skeletonema_dohrnii-CCMP3373.AAC.1